jgi:2'-5' RNA ligase
MIHERKSEAVIRRAIVLFPKLAQIGLIEQFRQVYDPLAPLIPAHVTLVFPFECAISTEDLLLHMSNVAGQFHSFPLLLQGITGHMNEYLFLNVKSGNDQLIALHDQLYTAALAPYLTAQETYFPHLTVGRLSSTTTFVEALRQAQSITPSFETEVQEICAYRIKLDGNGQVECKVKLS